MLVVHDYPPPHPPHSKAAKFKKTIMVVSLSRKGKGKERQRLDYTTVTQVVVSLRESNCTVAAVGAAVTQHIGFDVILMDSKCYPLMNSDGTSGSGFWKSTQKILAASRSLFEKLTSVSSNADITDRAVTDLTADGEPGPFKKKKLDTLDEDTVAKLSRVDKRLSFIDLLAQSFQCVIC